MKLLFLTQVLDRQDAILGFVPRWIEGMARHVEALRVIALELGDLSGLPANVDAREVGRKGRLVRWLRYQRFLREAFERDGFDTVLGHMVPRYTLLADRRARAAGAAHFLWYTHGGVDARLRKAERLVDAVFTASAESFRIESAKKIVTGHGIDVAHFDSGERAPERPARLLAVGRLTPAKDALTTVAALELLVGKGRDVHLDWVGGGLHANDGEYRARVQSAITAAGLDARVHLHGSVPYLEMPEHYARSTLLLSASRTGSVDKVVLEAMAARRPVVTSNESFPELLRPLGAEAGELCFPAGDAGALAARVEALLQRGDDERLALGSRLRRIVAEHHEVDDLMRRLVQRMGQRP